MRLFRNISISLLVDVYQGVRQGYRCDKLYSSGRFMLKIPDFGNEYDGVTTLVMHVETINAFIAEDAAVPCVLNIQRP